MTQGKELLLKDLCARLPYGVIVNVKGFDYDYNDKLTQISWTIKQYEPLIYRMVSWDYDKINEYVSNMEIGETRILEA